MNDQDISASSVGQDNSQLPLRGVDTRQPSSLRTTPTPKQSCESTGPTSQSTTISGTSIPLHHLDYLRRECLALLHQSPGICREVLTSTEDGSGQRSPESSARHDPSTQSWRTQQVCFPWMEDGPSQESYLNFTQSGMMLGGKLWELTPLVRHTGGIASGSLLPTPSGVNGGVNHTAGRLDEWGGNSNPFRGTSLGKSRCGIFEEWIMGMDIHHTALTPSETPSSRKSLT